MDTSIHPVAGVDERIWEQLTDLEARHRVVRARHDAARRKLEQASAAGAPAGQTELLSVWREYCAVVAELDRSTAAFDAIRRGCQ